MPSKDAAIATMYAANIIEMSIDRLQPYPSNEEINPPCAEEADRQLRESLERDGQRDAIHVMPPGNAAGLPDHCILDGHRRLAALKAIGVKTAKVVMRRDLLDADRAKVHATYLSFNRDRRQLDGLALANNLREQLVIDRKSKYGLSACEKGDLARRLAGLLGTTLRNAFRYVHGAHAPAIVQTAHRDGCLGLNDLARVGMIYNSTVREEIAKQIQALNQPSKAAVTQIVRRHLTARASGKKRRDDSTALRLIRLMQAHLTDLDGRYGSLHGPTLAPHREFLIEARGAIDLLIKASRRPGKSAVEAYKASTGK